MRFEQQLLRGLLQRQLAADDQVQIADARLLAALRGELQLRLEEQLCLWNSPVTRQRLQFLQQLDAARALQTWQEAEPLLSRAAATTAVEQIDLQQPDYQLSLIPHDAAGVVWEMVLVVAEERRVQSGVSLVERDSGVVWLTGALDSQGELSGFWPFTESPMQRLQQCVMLLLPC